MPKARPLPDDPIARERLLKRRAAVKACVIRWRKRHVEVARSLYRHCEQLKTIKRKASEQRATLSQQLSASKVLTETKFPPRKRAQRGTPRHERKPKAPNLERLAA